MKISSSITTTLSACLLSVCLLLAFGTASCFADAPLRTWPVVARGDQDVNVRAVQLLLKAHGYPVRTDGVFGRATQTALRKFQSDHSLVPSGETNNPTWEALIMSVHQGSTGPAVSAAQYELRGEGYEVPTDGIFGLRVKAAVQKFQRVTGHTVDGVIGRQTWYEIVGGSDPASDQ